jgi:transcriptional regulator with XRE-family HTH domain
MSNVPRFQLCLQEDGADAVRTLRTATGLSLDGARSIVLAVDNVTASVFSTISIGPADTRKILAIMWAPQVALHGDGEFVARATLRPRGRGRIEQDQQFLRELAERLHVIRRARRTALEHAAHATGIPTDMLRLLEAGDMPASLLGLRALADFYQVPLPMLVDPKATPIRVLRLLAGQPG